MTPISKPIIFFGTEDFSLTALTGLIEAGYDIKAVVTKPDSKKGRGQHLAPPAVKVVAASHNIPVWQPEKLTDITEQIKAAGPVAGVLVSFGKIIPQATIDLFTPGIINLHPSLLPLYRGPSPIESVIKHGDSQTGVSIMQLSAKMDAGPVYSQVVRTLTGAETRAELYRDLAVWGTELLLELLPTILDGTLQPAPQHDESATYSHLLKKEDADLMLSTLSAQQAERLVRAHLGFPKSKVTIAGQSIIITSAHVSPQQKTPLDLACKDGAFLSIDTLVAPSGKNMSAADFIRGYLAE